jgi:hypothetical protein
MKRSIITALILALISTVWFLTGCGNPTGGGGGGGGGGNVSGPNLGTVSGHVYKANRTTQTLSGIAGYIITVSAEAMSVDVTVSSDANGYYVFNDLPSGEVTVTVTEEDPGYFDATSFTANSDRFDFIVENDFDPGTATVRGTVEGVPGSLSDNAVYISSYTVSGKAYDDSCKYYATASTYEVTGAPAENNVYLSARWYEWTGTEDIDHYAYKKLDLSAGGITYSNITFEAPITIEGVTAIPPSGYTIYNARVNLENDHSYIAPCGGIWSSLDGTSGRISRVMPIKSGERNYICFYSDNGANCVYRKYFYGRTQAEGQTFNFSSPSILTPLITNMTDGGSITGIPTIEWNSVPAASYYKASISDDTSYDFDWFGYTNDTRISLPPYLMSKLVSGHDYYISVYAYKYVNAQSPYLVDSISPSNVYLDSYLSENVEATWH